MSERDLISVIIPVYKVEAYLKKCIDSVLRQTYPNLEIILIDDGSPDRCGAICDSYKAADCRIKVIHKENGGLSDARNVGINHAQGDYIGFIDSDDAISPFMYEELLKIMKETKGDIGICNLEYVEEDFEEEEKILADIIKRDPGERGHKVISQRQAQEVYFDKEKRIIYTVTWNKLYKKELFNNIRFPKGKIHEDEFTTFKLLYNAKKIVYMDVPLYYYRTRKNSIMGQFNSTRFDLLEAYRVRMRFYLEMGEYDLWKRMIFLYIRMFTQYTRWIEKKCFREQNLAALHRGKFTRLFFKNKNKVTYTFLEKAEYRLFLYCFPVYRIFWTIFNTKKFKNIFRRLYA